LEKEKQRKFVKNKNFIIFISVVALLLLIPLIAMQFTNEVKWTLIDFIVAAALLLGTGLTCNFVMQKVKNIKLKVAICLAILAALLLIWVELAVGIF
jgi:hypothetical protein